MKKFIALALAALVGLTANAQTNITIATPVISTNLVDTPKTFGGYELTFGGGGTEIDGQSAVGLDFSIATNPFEKRPEVWLGLAQSLYWEPSFAGSSDIFVDWSFAVRDNVSLNVGWSGGVQYAHTAEIENIWRSGPEATLQYYTSGNAFIYGGVNYDVYSSDDQEGNWRYSFGIGLAF